MISSLFSKLTFTSAVLGLLCTPALASAAPFVDLLNVNATWSVPADGGGNSSTFGFSGNGTQHAIVNWGTPQDGTNKSGFEFEGTAPPAQNNIDVGSVQPFDLGKFTHNNFVITNGDDAPGKLDLVLDLTFNNVDPAIATTTFNFSFEETSNSSPCVPAGSTICPDVVGFTNNGLSQESVRIDDQDFFLELLGFRETPGGPLVTEFVTEEGQASSAILQAQFTPVPIPSSVFLFATGLASLIGWKRYQGKNV